MGDLATAVMNRITWRLANEDMKELMVFNVNAIFEPSPVVPDIAQQILGGWALKKRLVDELMEEREKHGRLKRLEFDQNAKFIMDVSKHPYAGQKLRYVAGLYRQMMYNI